ncbi:hypothetical protein HY413_03220 [Candidatus Kaiserbacteria bacterium]|nr:hypothetical protein [Candidatus Kaiserbacteria bacterium]
MKQSLHTLMTETVSAEEVLASNMHASAKVSRTAETIKRRLSQLQNEVYDRVWAGETTGDKIDDIVIATKGRYDAQVAGKLRVLMEKFARHQGQFVAGRHHADTHSFDHVLVGIVDADEPLFCYRPKEAYTKPYIELPIKPAIFYDSGWQWGFKNLEKSAWRISIDKEESLSRQRCWGLERLLEVDMKCPSIHIGDEAVWEFFPKTGRHKFGSLVTFAHIASALGRPLSTIPAFKERVEPFVTEAKSLVPNFVKAHAVLAEIGVPFAPSRKHPFVKDFFEEAGSALHDIKESLGAMKRFLRAMEHPHKIKKVKS